MSMLISCVAYRDGKKLAEIATQEIHEYLRRTNCFEWDTEEVLAYGPRIRGASLFQLQHTNNPRFANDMIVLPTIR